MSDTTQKSQFNLPNTLTVLRIALVPVFLYTIALHDYGHALLIFGVSAVTDLLDGFLARRMDELTKLGKILDPIADKLTLVSSFIVCGLLGLVPLWLAIVVVGRDIIIISGDIALYIVARRFWIDPLWPGKAAIAAQFALLCYVLLNARYGFAPALAGPLYVVTVVLTVLSGLQYMWEATQIAIREKKRR